MQGEYPRILRSYQKKFGYSARPVSSKGRLYFPSLMMIEGTKR